MLVMQFVLLGMSHRRTAGRNSDTQWRVFVTARRAYVILSLRCSVHTSPFNSAKNWQRSSPAREYPLYCVLKVQLNGVFIVHLL